MSTSEIFASSRTSFWPSGLEMLSVIDFLPRLADVKYAESLLSRPSLSFTQGGPKARESSPEPGRSTLITSAPRSARFCPAQGPASTRERSRTRMCESGPVMSFRPLETRYFIRKPRAGDAERYNSGGFTEHGMRFPRWKTICAAAMCAPLLAIAQQQPSDYRREKRWADEIVPQLVSGEPVWLEAPRTEKFLGIYTEVKNAKGAIILAHGLGVHPDHGLIGELRTRLADTGYTTLSIQMPILSADAPPARYPVLFWEADARFAAAMTYLKRKRNDRIVLLSHSMGSRMANHYVGAHPLVPLAGWISLSISSGDFAPIKRVKFPVFDVYAENDLDAVLQGAQKRAAALKRMRGSSQAMVFATDHFFARKEKELVSLIGLLLEGERK